MNTNIIKTIILLVIIVLFVSCSGPIYFTNTVEKKKYVLPKTEKIFLVLNEKKIIDNGFDRQIYEDFKSKLLLNLRRNKDGYSFTEYLGRENNIIIRNFSKEYDKRKTTYLEPNFNVKLPLNKENIVNESGILIYLDNLWLSDLIIDDKGSNNSPNGGYVGPSYGVFSTNEVKFLIWDYRTSNCEVYGIQNFADKSFVSEQKFPTIEELVTDLSNLILKSFNHYDSNFRKRRGQRG